MQDHPVQPDTQQPEAPIRIALLVEYCGTGFHGSQFQPGHPTVQQALQEALRALNLQTSAVTFAGRTDTGVHAQGQVAHFDIAPAALENIPSLAMALNAKLPDTVAVRMVHIDVGSGFHSRREAGHKWYRYRIYNHKHRSVWMQNAAHRHIPLDAARMHQAAQLLLGRHDFKSFKDSDTAVTDDICHVRHAAVSRDGDFVHFDIVADRFLYKMVRNLAGQLMVIGNVESPLPPESIRDVMAARNRARAAATAPPEGLTLMAVTYAPPYRFFAQDAGVRQLEQFLNQHPTMESLQNENLFRKAS